MGCLQGETWLYYKLYSAASYNYYYSAVLLLMPINSLIPLSYWLVLLQWLLEPSLTHHYGWWWLRDRWPLRGMHLVIVIFVTVQCVQQTCKAFLVRHTVSVVHARFTKCKKKTSACMSMPHFRHMINVIKMDYTIWCSLLKVEKIWIRD